AALVDRVDALVTQLGERDYHVREIDAEGFYNVSLIAAPVFDSSGRVCLALTLVGFPDALTGSEVTRLGETVRDATRAASRKTGGRVA
ncbi:MAG TPA: IclR family transcriptional regulator C-terminal domain-containing protein, partial [Ilumatobacteraceae bacterium]|nr:IclR family transcriptional regulator C-terminal domain-containing protein [Ilumatobacteraceae bacterium]